MRGPCESSVIPVILPMRVELHPAWVLHQRAYQETSLLLEVFSSQQGRIGLIAKGAKRPRSRLRGILQPFHPLLIAWSGRGDLGTLTQAEPDGPSFTLVGRRLVSGFYLNELLMRLLHRHEAHAALFKSYCETLRLLSRPGAEEPVLRIFEKRLLEAIGYGLVLDHEVASKASIEAERAYYYQQDKGPWSIPPPCVPAIEIRGQTLIALACERIEDPLALREAKLLMRFVLKPHLGDKPLQSRELFISKLIPLHPSPIQAGFATIR